MNNIDGIFERSKDAREFAAGYLEYLAGLLRALDCGEVARFIGAVERARAEGRTVFVIGNGGSAATASHMANDFGIGTRVPEGSPPFRVLSLTDNVPVMTAAANDDGYDSVFVVQLRVHFRPGDTLVAISASGNSANLLEAVSWFRAHGGGPVIGLLGFDGGKLKTLCDFSIHVRTPKGEYGPVEDAHMVMDHLAHAWLGRAAAREAAKAPARG